MLAARWRWNLTRALVLPRARGGKRRPIHLQRMEADDLLAAVWPSLAACQENAAAGPVDGARSRAGAPDRGRLPARRALGGGPGRPVVEGGVGAGRRAHGGVVRALAPVARDSERASLHLPRRGAAGGTAYPRPLVAPWPGRARPQRAARAGRRAGRAGSRRSGPRARPGAAAPSAAPTSCTTCCSRSWPVARCRSGRPGSRRWSPTAVPPIVDGCWVATEQREAAAALRRGRRGRGGLRRRASPAGRPGHRVASSRQMRRCPPGRPWGHR